MKSPYNPVNHSHIFLNHASVSVPAQSALDAMLTYTQSLSQPFNLKEHEEFLAAFKERVRKLLRVNDKHSIVPISGTAFGLSALAQTLPLRRFDNILLYGEEYPANYYPWATLAYEGILVKTIPPNPHGGLRIDDLVDYADSHTRAIVVSSVQFMSGHRTDLASLGQYCRERDMILIVDGIQSLGVLPLYPEKLGIHALATGSQKWFLGPLGSGFLYVNSWLASRLLPKGPIGAYSVVNPDKYLPYHFVLRPGAERFELGTSPMVVHHGLYAAIGTLLQVNLNTIADSAMHLARVIVEDLKKRGYPIIGSPNWHERSPITTFRPRNPGLATKQLKEANIIITYRDGMIRVAPHYYNTEDEVLSIGEVLEDA